MALTYSEMIPLNAKAADFTLEGILPSGELGTVSLNQYKDKKALLVMFICNHCPYVQAINARLAQLAQKFVPKNVGIIAINSNDSSRYPEDSLEKMREQHRTHGFNFAYLVDKDQQVAKNYGAVCTPDFFLFDNGFSLKYRGRLDDNWKEPEKVQEQDLAESINTLLDGLVPDADQVPSMGCSIKWKTPY